MQKEKVRSTEGKGLRKMLSSVRYGSMLWRHSWSIREPWQCGSKKQYDVHLMCLIHVDQDYPRHDENEVKLLTK